MKLKRKIIVILLCLITIFAILFFITNKSTKYSSRTNNSPTFRKMKEMTQDELVSTIENITDEQLVEIAYYSNGILSKDFHYLDTFSVDFLKEKDDFQGERWYESNVWLAGSVSSLKQAEDAALYFAKSDDYTDYSVDYIGENDLYYQFRVIRGRFAYRMIFYKNSVIKYIKEDPNYYGFYRFEDAIFQKRDYDTVYTIMDLENPDVLYRYFEEKDDEYIYTCYKVTTVGGDWGVNSTVSLTKYVTEISKTTGEMSTHTTIIKKDVTIPNSAPTM